MGSSPHARRWHARPPFHIVSAMSGGVRVDGSALEVVAGSLETRAGTLRSSDTCLASPDAGRSSDEISAALTSVREGVTELTAGIDALATRLRDAVTAYAAWDSDTAQATPTVTSGPVS